MAENTATASPPAVDSQLAALTGQVAMLAQMVEKQFERNAQLDQQLQVLLAAAADDPDEEGISPEAFAAKRKSRVVEPPKPKRPTLPIEDIKAELMLLGDEPLRTELESLPQLPDLMQDLIDTPLGDRPVSPSVDLPGVVLVRDLAAHVKNRWHDNPKGSLALFRGKRDPETRSIVNPGPLDDLILAVRRAA